MMQALRMPRAARAARQQQQPQRHQTPAAPRRRPEILARFTRKDQQQQQQQQPGSSGGPSRGAAAATPSSALRPPPSSALRPGETAEQASERRVRESMRVEERVADVEDAASWRRALEGAGDRLVVLEVEAEGVCQTGLEEEADLQWELDKRAALQPCLAIKSALQRTARECPDVVFLSLSADTDEGAALCAELGVEVLPTIQFWRRGRLLWEHRGVLDLEQDLGEGVLYFGGAAGAGGRLDAQGAVAELKSKADLEAFVAEGAEEREVQGGGEQGGAAAASASADSSRVLSVVNVATSGASPCIHVYPAVVALARSFQGYARFARLLVDDLPKELLQELGVIDVPTFIFFRGGREVGRHVGSSRGDLMGRIMETQMEAGVRPPPPPASAKRRVPERRVIKRRV